MHGCDWSVLQPVCSRRETNLLSIKLELWGWGGHFVGGIILGGVGPTVAWVLHIGQHLDELMRYLWPQQLVDRLSVVCIPSVP